MSSIILDEWSKWAMKNAHLAIASIRLTAHKRPSSPCVSPC
jgi:hypothetical protein